jgi:hypothetical protein
MQGDNRAAATLAAQSIHKGTLMKTKLTALIAIGALTLSACGGVDRDGTRDKFVEDMQEQLGATTDPDCVDTVFDDYSDDEITALSDGADDERTAQLATELLACTDLGG